MTTIQAEQQELTDIDAIEDEYRLHRRFDRMGRLVGDDGMKRLLGSRVAVIGLGGVGSHAAEALVRSGVGYLRAIDFDKVCITNTNRQVQSLKGNVGRHKATVLGERLRLINPQAEIDVREAFYTAHNADEMLEGPLDYVVDAIDNITAKCHLLATCVARGIPVITSTGASGRMDPTQVQLADLAKTRLDPLAQSIRKILRKKYEFPANGPFGIAAVFSEEQPILPQELHYDKGQGFRCVCPGGKNSLHDCDNRNMIYGTAGFVTATFGMTCASVVVKGILNAT